MQTRVVFNVLKSALRQPDSHQLLMLALALLNGLILVLILFISNAPGIQSLWFIPTLGVICCVAAALLSPLKKSIERSPS